MTEMKMISHIGDREINEDSVRSEEENGELFLVLADGLGGHGKGEVASALVSDTAIKMFRDRSDYPKEQLLCRTFEACQKELLFKQEQENSRDAMKTTLVLCLVDDKYIRWGHIGDSRLYLFERRKIVARTYDHSVPQMLVYAKKIKEKQVRFHEDRNRLLKVMGIEWKKPEYELHDAVSRVKNQALLLCTDGFWEWIDEKTMQKCLKKADSAQSWIDMMEKTVLENGRGKNMDNYSAIGVWL